LVGMRVLSQVISASSFFERNCSAHGHIHLEVCNRLAPATTEKVYIILIGRQWQQRLVMTS
jgi:hypothetical protein